MLVAGSVDSETEEAARKVIESDFLHIDWILS
jgi:hypothetical protein